MHDPVSSLERKTKNSSNAVDWINRSSTLPLAVLAVITIIAFLPTIGNDFVNWDDRQNLVQNDAYRGFSADHIRWMFTTTHGGHYQPLSWLSFAMDYGLWGLNPAGFHFTNLILHILTGILFFVAVHLLYRTAVPREHSGFMMRGALIAALWFSVHPLRVESVAWATERRDVLSGAWLMLTLLGYLHAQDRNTPSRYYLYLVLSLFAYICSLLSKATAVTLPVVLLILDIYPLRRISITGQTINPVSMRRIMMEKIIYLFPAVTVAVIAVQAQSQSGALWGFQEHPLSIRIGQAFYGILFYPMKTLWPAGLIPLYEQQPGASAWDMVNILSAGGVIVFTVTFWKLRRRIPSLITCWCIYLVVLSPMLGLAQSGPQVVADRYSYLSCMPWAILVGGCYIRLRSQYKQNRMLSRATSAILIVITIILVVLTRNQTRIWSDSYTLWTTTIARSPDTATAHVNLAVVLNERKEFTRSIEHSRIALEKLPNNRIAHIALARASASLNVLETADQHFRIALNISQTVGKTDTATMVHLAHVQTQLDRLEEAERLYRDVIDLEPEVPEWFYNLAGFLASQYRFEESIPFFQKVIDLDPRMVQAYQRLGVVWMKMDQPTNAIEIWEQGLHRTPRDPDLQAQLAWTLATCKTDSLRNGQQAITLAWEVFEDTQGRHIRSLEALAAGLAETGDFRGAIQLLEKALDDRNHIITETSRSRIEMQLEAYRAGQPVRE